MSFSETFENFLSAKLRTNEECLLEPDFIDSPLFNNRASMLMAGESIQRFILDGADVLINNKLVAKLVPPHPPRLVNVSDAFFLSHESGVAPECSEHAGDLFFVCESATDAPGCIVARHWQRSEKPCLTWQSDGDGVGPTEILGLRAHGAGAGAGGGAPAALASESLAHPRHVNTVQDGMLVLTVSPCINFDYFETRRGKKESLGGVYLSYLSVLFERRPNSHRSRTTCATPSDVDSDDVLRAITPDLVEGATSGWICHQGDGSPVRIMADVSMFVGDYLQVFKTSMLVGYGAKAPCPLCSYRVPGVSGSRFGLHGSSSDVEMERTTARTRSVCRAVKHALSQT